MHLTFIGKDPLSNPTGSPTVYTTSEGTLVVQGWMVGEEARRQMHIPEGEDAVEIPVRMLPDIMEGFLRVSSWAIDADTIRRVTGSGDQGSVEGPEQRGAA